MKTYFFTILVKQKPKSDWYMFRSGLHSGMLIILLFWVIWINTVYALMVHPLLPVFRLLLSCVLIQWCCGISVYLWTKYLFLMNFIFLFFIRNFIFYSATNNSILLLVSILLFSKLKIENMFFLHILLTGIVPLMITFWLIYLCLHTKWSWRIIKEIGKVFFAPLFPVTFLSSFIGDIATSLVRPLTDLAYTVCYMGSGGFVLHHQELSKSHNLMAYTYTRIILPIICFLPLWLRMQQNLRVYYDTRKRWPSMYVFISIFLSHVVVLFGTMHPMWAKTDYSHANSFEWAWITSYLIATIYAFLWDIKMYHLMFGVNNRHLYYTAIVFDALGRFIWCLTLLPGSKSVGHFLETPNYVFFLSCLGPLEILRRCMYVLLFFLLEQEHLHNTMGFRKVNFIPLHFETPVKRMSRKSHDRVAGKSVFFEMIFVFVFVVTISIYAAFTGSKNS
eukprot:GSMAST32.ASY1.ANO1.891.1 assembled CDS